MFIELVSPRLLFPGVDQEFLSVGKNCGRAVFYLQSSGGSSLTTERLVSRHRSSGPLF